MASHTVDPVHYPTDREFEKLGYDIESSVPDTGKLRFIEVKGRVSGASTVTFTRNEILYSLNKPEDFILGIVEFLDDGAHRVHHVREPFKREPDFGVTSVNTDSLGNLAPFAVRRAVRAFRQRSSGILTAHRGLRRPEFPSR